MPMNPGQSTEDRIREEHDRLKESFYAHPAARAVPDLALYHWYHTVDLGNGLVTPGQYDYRETMHAFPFPADMTGATLLEVGSATGFFSFEAERRGATVTSVELPSFHHLDRFPGQTQTRLLRRLAQMRTPDAPLDTDPLVAMSSGQTYFYHLDGPFQFCYLQLGSRIERIYSTIYDLKHSTLAGRKFDYVLLGDVLVHLFNPVQALAVAAEFAAGNLVISQLLPEVETAHPVIEYVGGASLEEDDLCWFLPNLAFFREFLKKLGFRSVEETGRNRGHLRPSGYAFDRSILVASR